MIAIAIIAIIIFIVMALWAFLDDEVNTGTMLFIGVLVLALGLGISAIRIIPSGHVGVQTLFGKVYENELKEGMHFVNPFKRIRIMTVRTQERFEKALVPSKEGLSINLEASLLYSINPSSASDIYKTIGRKYAKIVIVPTFRSSLRDATVNYQAKDLYTANREAISSELMDEIKKSLKTRGIVVEKVLLRKIGLPKQLKDAIERKLKADQEAQQMEFVLEKEKAEADRKRIEAKGIQDFQNIVRKGIDGQLLKWKALESVDNLAESDNSKFIILGDKSGLPIIVNPN